MSKITFRADDALIDHIESLDASKSEIMRDALRTYLGLDVTPGVNDCSTTGTRTGNSEEQIEASTTTETATVDGIDVTVRITPTAESAVATGPAVKKTADGAVDRCAQCGETIQREHKYCPNCGQSHARRIMCECGDDLRSDWSFCPSCGRRTPSADVLDRT